MPENHLHDSEATQWKILIVDDDPDNLEVAAQFLELVGGEVKTARNGSEGLALLDSFKPTFILLDLSMPAIDGWEMIKRIRQRPQNASTPVIALTAHAMHGDEERVLQAGFDGYVSKPFMLTSLLQDIKRCLVSASQRS